MSIMHRDLGLPTPWLDSGLCSSFVKSATKLATATEHPNRKPLLAEHVMQFLRLGMFSADIAFVRAVVAVILAFLTSVRGASIMQLAVSDVQDSDKGFEVRVWDEKSRKGTGVAWSVSIEFAACPLVGQVVLLFSQLQAQAFRPSRPQGLSNCLVNPFLSRRVFSTIACGCV